MAKANFRKDEYLGIIVWLPSFMDDATHPIIDEYDSEDEYDAAMEAEYDFQVLEISNILDILNEELSYLEFRAVSGEYEGIQITLYVPPGSTDEQDEQIAEELELCMGPYKDYILANSEFEELRVEYVDSSGNIGYSRVEKNK